MSFLSSQSFVERLRSFVTGPRAEADLRRYFGVEMAEAPFDGAFFEGLGGGGDRPDVVDVITAEDLIAVQALSVRVPTSVMVDIFEGPLGAELADLLRAIPADLDMAAADLTHLQDGSPADQAWRLLEKQSGVGWVTAGKLLARKRPRLIPVYDRVVRCALGRPDDFWLALHAALRVDGAVLQRSLLELREAAGVPDRVSALRVCDVVVWMQHRDEHQNCP